MFGDVLCEIWPVHPELQNLIRKLKIDKQKARMLHTSGQHNRSSGFGQRTPPRNLRFRDAADPL